MTLYSTQSFNKSIDQFVSNYTTCCMDFHWHLPRVTLPGILLCTDDTAKGGAIGSVLGQSGGHIPLKSWTTPIQHSLSCRDFERCMSARYICKEMQTIHNKFWCLMSNRWKLELCELELNSVNLQLGIVTNIWANFDFKSRNIFHIAPHDST